MVLFSATFLGCRYGGSLLLGQEVEPLAVEYLCCAWLVGARDREPQGSTPSGIRLARLGPDDFTLDTDRLESCSRSSQIAEFALEYDHRILIHRSLAISKPTVSLTPMLTDTASFAERVEAGG